ncbi:PREDICTED: E3 ubiquitin-protein ligase NEDD4-like [Amphimedon queenslandica]|uniref:E3 ubiquitin-protein ligase n=1 Tax=Amphimedon queenslandica TaxID=400682 RepID=A0AAN0J6F4_AMPQE|nr:PREDICTED: E3 ubiquitin-protein ligase NEDD4-like [Amphimedon queenslandica]|eukprot:XP_019852268.1 PREDICTED: E3 ubiquitin-protein ligase NEDD4-like [Amphimedon queenslandica]
MAARGGSEPLMLHVFIMSSQNLMKKDLFGMCDPYVKVTLRRGKKTKSKQTKTRHKTRNPEWSEKLEFPDINLEHDIVLFEVFDANRLTRDNFLGRVIIKLSQYPIERQKVDITQPIVRPHSFDLRGRSAKSRVSGSIKLKLLFHNNPLPSSGGSSSSISSSAGPPLPPRGRIRSSSGNLPRQQNIGQLVQGAAGPVTASVSPNSLALSRQSTVQGDGWTMEEREEDEPPLPPGWEARQDANGRTFYVDHANRHTQWVRPVAGHVPDISAQRRIERDRRFQQTMRRRIPTSDNGSSTPLGSMRSITPSPTPSPRSIAPSQGSPGRPVSAADSLSQRLSTASLSGTDDLPPGWEMRTAENGRQFYVDHNTRTTHWTRPRQRALSTTPAVSPGPRPSADETPPPLPPPRQSIRPQSSIQSTPPPRASITPATQALNTPMQVPVTPTSNGGNGRGGGGTPGGGTPGTPGGSRPRTEDLGDLPPGWELRILPDGRNFFIDHNTHSTQWEDPRLVKTSAKQSKLTYDRNYKMKYDSFQKALAQKRPEGLPRQIEIPVRRDHLFEDSHRKIMTIKNKDHLKARLYIKFPNETGLDYGGLAREWFFLLSHEMFNPYYGLFEYSASDNYTLQVNPDSGMINENHLDYFRFIGRIFGLAIYHKKLIDAFFVRPFYKVILGRPVVLADMEAVDTEFYNSVKYILDNDPEPLCLTFTASREFLGQVEEIELKPNGGDIDVVEDNKKEYVRLLMKWRFEDRCAKQMDAIKKGISDIFPLQMLKVFDEREIEVSHLK